MTYLRWILAFGIAVAVAGCSTTRFDRTVALQSGTEISGSSLVVYSFLDVRKGLFGEKMLSLMNDQLVDGLKQRGVAARVVVYDAGTDLNPNALYLGLNRSVVTVPLKDYVKAQRPAEEKHGDKFRLMVFPSMVTTTGAAVDSHISWTLTDIASDKPVWTTKQSTSRTIWWNTEEAPETRSKQFVEGILNEMTKSGLFGAAARQHLEQQEDAKRKKTS